MPENTVAAQQRVRFGAFEADLQSGELRKGDIRIALPGQSFEVLTMLLARRGEMVSREELRQKLWPADTFVDFDHGLNKAINRLREALGDSADAPRFIETLPRRGYRFVAPVDGAVSQAADAARPGRWWIAAAAVAVLLGVGGYAAWRHARSTAATGRVMLAVLPFENLSGDAGQEFFSDGLTDEMITQLGSLNPARLGVIARTTAVQYRRPTKNAAQIGAEMGVDFLLEGSVRRGGDRVRIDAQLIRVRDQTHLWAQSYERDTRDILSLERDVAAAIAEQTRLVLRAETRRSLAESRPVVPEAHEAYLKGLYFWNKFTVDDLRKASSYFEQAVAKDPGYAPAYAGLGAAYGIRGNFGELPPNVAYPRAQAAAQKAIALDDTVSFAHGQLGFMLMFYDHDWAGAEREFRRAIELNPSNANAHQGYAAYLAAIGRLDESRAEMERARALDPLSLIINGDVALMLFFSRQYDEALAQLAKLREMNSEFAPAYWTESLIYQALDRQEESSRALVKSMVLASNHSEAAVAMEKENAQLGWRATWERCLRLARNPVKPQGYVSHFRLAESYLRLGDDAHTIEDLAKSAANREFQVAFLNVDPRFDRLRANPRFQDVIRALNLPK